MDHAEVLERLDAAFVGPGKIWSVERDETPDGVALREHLASCDDCGAEYDALVLTGAALAVAAPDTVTAPAWAKERVLARVREVGMARGSGWVAADAAPGPTADVSPLRRARRQATFWGGLALAASIVLLVLGGALGRTFFPVGETAADEVRQLASLATAISDLVADPKHRSVRLQSATSQDAGLVLLSGDGRRLAVTSNAIEEPQGDRQYDCYVERDGQRILVGRMHFAHGLAYWAGPVQAAGDVGQPGDRFVVLERHAGATPELSGTF